MLRDEVAKYTELSGNDGEHTPICVIGAYLDGYDKGLELSVSENSNKWIPVSERLPEFGKEVLTYHEDDEEYQINWVIDDETGKWFYDNPTAWQPLPSPWKGE